VHTKVERSIVFDDVEIAAGCQLCNCIVDKHTRIPRDERIGFDLESDRRRFTVTDRGIAVVPKGYNF
jgi:glucose-1-phosphate adenylyltransferase